ncbi:COP1-interacting protein 7-like [Mercurialis annua]|uniref:COP1-interacting protein 7-like n=1 Tax=Mercurialis annua TaxID=3986 RepID=UPI00215F9E22|nr:COP1-interacting protein 7-like [Mercurialis annua]
MESCIDGDAPLDYATIQIFPAHNRYEVFVCGGGEVEKLTIGLLEQLLPHLPGVNNLHAKGSNANLKLQLRGLHDTTWFTKSTLNRFLQIVSSPDFMKSSKLVEGEMSQLEEARKFHLSIHPQGHANHFESGQTDGCNLIETVPTLKPEVQVASSDTSKDELVRAMDLRLTSLRKELAAGLSKAAGLTCSSKDIYSLISFCETFGATDVKISLCKFLELCPMSDTSVFINDDKHSFMCMSVSDDAKKTNGDTQVSRSSHSQTPVKYGVSSALAAQVERQSSSESEASTNSSDINQKNVERSRALTRSSQPRRSASPMRRVQIGRAGSRRAAALTIKSLGNYPARERIPFYRDEAANSSEEEGSEKIGKKHENNMRRMTVQDAINLFENKQKDESSDAQKGSSSSSLSLSTKKSVLRRWSSGAAESSHPCQSKDVSEDSVQLSCDNVVDQESSNHLVEERLESDFISGRQIPSGTTKTNVELKGLERKAHEPVVMEIEGDAIQGQETNGTSNASAEWSQRKEVELNQMLTKMKESKSARVKKSPSSGNQNIPSEHRGGFYDHYKEKRNEKLRGENARKKAEKEAQFRAIQQTLDERKAEMASRNVKDVNKKHPSPKPQNSVKNASQAGNLKKDNLKASVTKKVPSKASTSPAIRKSWPSTPSTRVGGSSVSKSSPGISSTGTTTTIRKPQSSSPVIKSRPKVERSQPLHKNMEESQTDTDRILKVTNEKKQKTVTKTEKGTKPKIAAAAGDRSGKVPSKPSLYNKMTKKGSVVPVESKPFLRKGSGIAPGIGPIVSKKRCSPQVEETSINSGNMTESLGKEVATKADILIIQHEDEDIVSNDVSSAMQPEMQVNCHMNYNEPATINELAINGDDSFKETAESLANIEFEEESGISPVAWEEIEECQNVHLLHRDKTSQLTSPVHGTPVGLSSPRIRHSLSQMLQEEISEPDSCEWGNAENPPAMAFQKDAPKGLKRLLKFARKSKGDSNITGWSSPSVFSEGEDDAEESTNKRNTDSLLKKAALHPKNYGKQSNSIFAGQEKNTDARELLSAESNLGKFGVQNSHKLQKSNVSTATSKATRSFFSLSAFKGSKPNETRFLG